MSIIMPKDMKTVLVTGAKGQLGSSIASLKGEYGQYKFIFTDREELDLSDADGITAYFDSTNIDVIINCAAYTAVDQAETDYDLADSLNHQAVATMAAIAKKTGITFIHVSTDYVFNGKGFRPYLESDLTDPQSVYGSTKLKGELAFTKANPKGCIIRTSWVYSEYGNNFVKTMLRLGKERDELGVIFDQVGTPTYAKDLAKAIMEMISSEQNRGILESDNPEHKIYHFSNEGVCSWYDFAKTIFELSGVDCLVNPIETKQYPTPAARPHYSVMNKSKIKQNFNMSIPYWKNSLQVCVNSLEENS